MGTSPPRETVMSTTALKFLALAGVVCSQQYNYDINNPQPFNFQYRGTGQSNYVGPDPTTYTYKFDPYKQVRYDFDLNNPLKAFRYQYKHQFDKAIDAKPNINIDLNYKYDPSNLNLDVPKPYKYEMKRDPNFVYRF